MPDSDGVMISKAAFDRIVKAVQWVERQPTGGMANRTQSMYQPGEQFILGTAAAAVTTLATTNNFTPGVPVSADTLSYYIDFSYVASGAAIALVWDQRNERYAVPIVQEIFECVLTADLSNNSSAAATMTKCDGTAGQAITVYDNGKIGSGYHFASGAKLSVYYSLCDKYYWLAGPCRVAD